MLSFWDWAGGPVVGSSDNDEILQSAGILSKYLAKCGKAEKHDSIANCKFLGINCDKKNKYGSEIKRRKNG